MRSVVLLLIVLGLTTALPVIIDTDAGPDDMAAIWYALRYPGADVRLITVAGNSWAHLGAAMTNVYNLLQLMGRNDVLKVPSKPHRDKRAAPDLSFRAVVTSVTQIKPIKIAIETILGTTRSDATSITSRTLFMRP